jgi:hypothetical protein
MAKLSADRTALSLSLVDVIDHFELSGGDMLLEHADWRGMCTRCP